MKCRESGMPDENDWDSFFDAECVVETMLGADGCTGNLVEFGCGYGTFTLPAARRTAGAVLALDIEAELIAQLQRLTRQRGVHNVRAELRDFLADGSGAGAKSQSHAMIYNLLHLEEPVTLLKEAYRVLLPGGKLSVIHWRTDIATPRGPSLDIRPTPNQCREWMEQAGFSEVVDVDLSVCCEFHFGLMGSRPLA